MVECADFCKKKLVSHSNIPCNFSFKFLMPNCIRYYWPKSRTRLFMFDDHINFLSTIVNVTHQNKP